MDTLQLCWRLQLCYFNKDDSCIHPFGWTLMPICLAWTNLILTLVPFFKRKKDPCLWAQLSCHLQLQVLQFWAKQHRKLAMKNLGNTFKAYVPCKINKSFNIWCHQLLMSVCPELKVGMAWLLSWKAGILFHIFFKGWHMWRYDWSMSKGWPQKFTQGVDASNVLLIKTFKL